MTTGNMLKTATSSRKRKRKLFTMMAACVAAGSGGGSFSASSTLLLPVASAFVPHHQHQRNRNNISPNTSSGGGSRSIPGPLSVMTEPPRTNNRASPERDGDNNSDDDINSSNKNKKLPESDYLLQTEDFTSEWRTPGTNNKNNKNSKSSSDMHLDHIDTHPSSELSEEAYNQLEELLLLQQKDDTGDSALQHHSQNTPGARWLSNPGVAWKHYMHATVKAITRHRNQRHDGPIDFLNNIITRPKLVSECSQWKRLEKHAEYISTDTHLRILIQDEVRSSEMYATYDGVYLDYSRQQVTLETMKFLYALAEQQNLKGKIQEMVSGTKINFTEDRAVLHTALRADRSQAGTVMVDGQDVIGQVHTVLDEIREFTDKVRSGEIRGYTGKRLRNIVSVGIGGSYLGPEFLHECLKTEPEGIHNSLGYSLRFLSNVDPVDVERTCADLDPEETLVVIVSKTFTTAETMLNARTMRQWLWDFMGNDKNVVAKHMVACASVSALEQVEEFGISQDYFFKFWDYVGGRYSVCSAAGAVPISLLYGFDLFEKFLKGANSIDRHFIEAPLDQNIPVLMGLLGVWNRSFLKYRSRTTLPYAEALLKLPAHIQQLDMESNGKSMTIHGLECDYPVGEIDFGEAGTNGQHSFYQLLHMGQTVPSEFIGFVQSQHDYKLDGESLSSHDELMANFFAQPDALATGKTAEEVRAEGVPPGLVGHKVFKGNRPSLSLLLPKLTAYACGQLLAIYEHRTAVQGFIWDINSFDQWGVELGKKLAIDVKVQLETARRSAESEEEIVVEAANPATTRLLHYYVENSQNQDLDEAEDGSLLQGGMHNHITGVTRKTHHHHYPPPQANDLGGDTGRI